MKSTDSWLQVSFTPGYTAPAINPLYAALDTERPCVLSCSGWDTVADGMTVFCTVDNDPTGEGITAIVYNANNRGVQLGKATVNTLSNET